MRLSVGHSDLVQPHRAVEAAAQSIAEALGSESPSGILVWAASSYSGVEVAAAVEARFPGVPSVGGTAASTLCSQSGFLMDGVAIAALTSVEVSVGVGRDLSQDPADSVELAVSAASGGVASPKLCVLSSAAFSCDLSELALATQRAVGEGCFVVGGPTADQRTNTMAEQRTQQFACGEVLEDSVCMMLIGGDFTVGSSYGSGWRPIGAEAVVTKAEGLAVHQLNGRPILDVIEGVWDADSIGVLGHFPLQVSHPSGDFLRAVLRLNPEDRSAVFAASIPEGSRVRITDALPGGILEGARDSAREALRRYSGSSPGGALVFSCASRKWLLGTRIEMEAEEVRRELGDIPFVSFYTFGEYVGTNLHNQTIHTVVLGHG